MKENMITGSPAKSLLFFTIPMILGNLFQQFYNMVDTMVVGKFVGEDALAAVGASFSVTMLFIAIATGSGIGCSVIISQLLGAKRFHTMKTAIYTAMISFLALSTVLTVLGLIINKALLRLMNTPDNILGDAMTYLGIYFGGLIFLFMYNVISNIFNALGDSGTPLKFLILSSLTNIVLDLWFVIRFDMGVAGVAWATLIAQGISAVLSFVVLMLKIRKMPHDGEVRLFDAALLGKMLRVALPSIVQQSIVSIGMLFVQIVINGFGSSVVAGFAAAMKIDAIAIMPMIAVGNAMSTFTAQNIGAGKEERIKAGNRACYIMVLVIEVVIFALIQIFGKTFIGAFLDTGNGSQALSTGISYLNGVSWFYFLLGLMGVANGILRGTGDMTMFMFSTLMNLIFRVAFAFGLAGVLGPQVVTWSVPIGWAIGYLIAGTRYFTGGWKGKRLVGEVRTEF